MIFIQGNLLENLAFHTLLTKIKESEKINNTKNSSDKFIPVGLNKRGLELLEDTDSNSYNDLAGAKWLIDDFAVSYLPSLKSFYVLRTMNYPSDFKSRFIGFGNPILDGNDKCKKNLNFANIFRNGHSFADLNKLCPLPETDNEIKMMNEFLKSQNNLIYLGEENTEKNFNSLGNISSEVITFATHGIVSNDGLGINESALLMTPPKKITELDDGLLMANEIAKKKINSNIVILSACNTGVEIGKNSINSLSKAFFFSGTRSLLVSNWEVETNSAFFLTTNFIKAYNSGLDTSEVLRQTIIKLKKDEKYHHPYFWGSFNLVGDGDNFNN